MLPTVVKMCRKVRFPGYLTLLFPLLVWIQPAFAQDNIDINVGITAQQMLTNFAKAVPNLIGMITAIAYVLGMYFIVSGIMKLKSFGESRTMMSQEHSVKGPMIFIVIGALLLYIPTSVQVGMSTFWVNPSPYGYLENKTQWGDFLNAVFVIVQLVGVIAFVRGLILMSHLSGHGQPGTFAKGLTHIIGGIFCINIYQFVQVILVTLGVQVTAT